ncbi:MAG: hypothetical protein JXB05_06560 [Myxococcaceae bacterium]|nr:hypothetical protein [Myxococcaceae bacterium]
MAVLAKGISAQSVHAEFESGVCFRHVQRTYESPAIGVPAHNTVRLSDSSPETSAEMGISPGPRNGLHRVQEESQAACCSWVSTSPVISPSSVERKPLMLIPLPMLDVMESS